MEKETKPQKSTDTQMGYDTVLATVFRGGNAGIEFDYKWFFRYLDYLRIGSKKLLTKLRLRDKQSCKYCGRDQHVVWSCKNEDWLKLPERWHNTALCLECFIALYPDNMNKADIKILGYDCVMANCG
jgi:hypothetical protein